MSLVEMEFASHSQCSAIYSECAALTSLSYIYFGGVKMRRLTFFNVC